MPNYFTPLQWKRGPRGSELANESINIFDKELKVAYIVESTNDTLNGEEKYIAIVKTNFGVEYREDRFLIKGSAKHYLERLRQETLESITKFLGPRII